MKFITKKNYFLCTVFFIFLLLYFFISKHSYSKAWEQPLLILGLIIWLIFSVLYEIKKETYSKSKVWTNFIVSLVTLAQKFTVNGIVSKSALFLFSSVCFFLTYYEYIKINQKK